jgi:GDPmannose 4,6-dehydratase
MKTALITGITGQDGAYLAKLLLSKEYKVYGMLSRRVNQSYQNLDFLGVKGVNFVYADLTDQCSIQNVIKSVMPDEIYNLGAMSFVGLSWDKPAYTSQVNGMGVLYMLEAIKNFCPEARFYQASTSEMYGNCKGSEAKNELTPFIPRSPYGVAKVFAHNMTVNYRESYGMFACCGILFNHESPIRGPEFVTRKISSGVAEIKAGKRDIIHLGNVKAERDWGYAGDYVEAMWLMLQQDTPEDYVIATGSTHSVEVFLQKAFAAAGLQYSPEYIYQDPKFIRPAELDVLLGDSTKAREKLGWKPNTSFDGLVSLMVQADIERLK